MPRTYDGDDPCQAAYRASLLRLHPDKAGFGARPIASFAANPAEWEKAKSPAEHNDAEFAAVQTAWHVLRDADGRAAYDRWLTAQRTQADVSVAPHIICLLYHAHRCCLVGRAQ